MGPKPDRISMMYGKNPKEGCPIDSATFEDDFNLDNMSDIPMSEASMSPTTKRVMQGELSGFEHSAPVEVEAEASVVKLLQRPISSGEEALAPFQYQMKAANLRPAHVKRPIVPNPHLPAPQNGRSVSLEDQMSSQPEAPNSNLERVLYPCVFSQTDDNSNVLRAEVPRRISPNDCALPRESPSGVQRPPTRGRRSGSGSPEFTASLNSGDEGQEFTKKQQRMEPQELNISVRLEGSAENRRNHTQQFQFTPLDITHAKAHNHSKKLVNNAKEIDVASQHPSASTMDELHTPSDLKQKTADAVLPSIEEESIDADETLLDRMVEPALHRRIASPVHKTSAQMEAPVVAANPDRQKSVLGGRVARNTTVRPKVQQKLSYHPQSMRSGAYGPSEEDMLYLIMRRSRLSKQRELQLTANNKQLQAQASRLHEQGHTWHQQLAAANIEKEQQESDINTYKSEIENFKTRFTKIKDYAKNLAQDHTDLRDTIKKASVILTDLAREKNEIRRDLKRCKQGIVTSKERYSGMTPKIWTITREARNLEQALLIAGEKARTSGANLHHERVRNKRMETQILHNQHTQEQIGLSSMQAYRSAAAELDDLCRIVLHLGKIVTKKLEPKDTPGVEQCLSLLQALKEKQSTGISTLAETKTVVSDVSKRLLTYHKTTEEAARASRSQSEQLEKDVLNRMTSTLGAVGPSIATEVEFAIMREKNKGLQTMITMGHQVINGIYGDKRASENREKEQSRRVDKLIDQVAEARKPPASVPQPSPPRNTGPDLNVMMTKYQQAHQNYIEEQIKVVRKAGELKQKGFEVNALREKLEGLQHEYDTSQAQIKSLQNVRGDADAAMQHNTALQGQLEEARAAAIEADRVPTLSQELAAKEQEIDKLKPEALKVLALNQELAARKKEISELQPEAAKAIGLGKELTAKDQEISKLKSETLKVTALSQELAARDQEIKKLNAEAAKLSALGLELTVKGQEIDKLKPEAGKVNTLLSKLIAREAELVKLRPLASQVPDLLSEVKAKDMEIEQLRPKAAQYDAKASRNLHLESEARIHGASIQSLGHQLTIMKQEADLLQKEHTELKAEAANSQITVASLQTELEKSQLSAQRVEVLQKEIATSTVDWGDQKKLKEELTAQQNINTQHVSQIHELKSKLEKEQHLSSHVPKLQDELQQSLQKCGKLGQEVEKAKTQAEKAKALETDLQKKDEETSALRSKLRKMEAIGQQLEFAKGESQQKTAQVAALEEQIRKLQVDSHRLSGIQNRQTQMFDEDENGFPTQATMLELAEMLDREDATISHHHSPTTQQSDNLLSNALDMPQRERATRVSFGPREHERRAGLLRERCWETQSSQKAPLNGTDDINTTQGVPDSQPQASAHELYVQRLLATSSPLSDHESNVSVVYRAAEPPGRQQHQTVSHPPSSSHGGDAMLLEDFEGIKSNPKKVDTDSSQQETGAQQPQSSQRHQGYGRTSLRTIVDKSGTETGRHRTRSGLSSQVIETRQSQQRVSTPNAMASSPPGVAKHLPNSAAKRPRIDTTEVTPSTQTNNKRLKRTPANLEIRNTPSKRPMPPGTREPERGRTNRVSLPSGSRKGSFIAANAPAPGKALGSKRASRKRSKSDRYAERFQS